MELRVCFFNPKNEDSYLCTHRHKNLKSYNHKNFLHWPKVTGSAHNLYSLKIYCGNVIDKQSKT
jgi:hypothetical protein